MVFVMVILTMFLGYTFGKFIECIVAFHKTEKEIERIKREENLKQQILEELIILEELRNKGE